MPSGNGRRTLLDLAFEMDTAVLMVQLRTRELSKFVCLAIIRYLVNATPADTSKAISNWRVAVGGTSYGAEPIPAWVYGKGGSTREASAARAINAAIEALKGAKAGKALAIINAVPYIKRLNEGWSSQAPAGFIEEAILIGRLAVKDYNFNAKLKADIKAGRLTDG